MLRCVCEMTELVLMCLRSLNSKASPKAKLKLKVSGLVEKTKPASKANGDRRGKSKRTAVEETPVEKPAAKRRRTDVDEKPSTRLRVAVPPQEKAQEDPKHSPRQSAVLASRARSGRGLDKTTPKTKGRTPKPIDMELDDDMSAVPTPGRRMLPKPKVTRYTAEGADLFWIMFGGDNGIVC